MTRKPQTVPGPPAGTPPHCVAELESVLCLIADETHDCQPYSYADAVALLARLHELAAQPIGWTP